MRSLDDSCPNISSFLERLSIEPKFLYATYILLAIYIYLHYIWFMYKFTFNERQLMLNACNWQQRIYSIYSFYSIYSSFTVSKYLTDAKATCYSNWPWRKCCTLCGNQKAVDSMQICVARRFGGMPLPHASLYPHPQLSTPLHSYNWSDFLCCALAHN